MVKNIRLLFFIMRLNISCYVSGKIRRSVVKDLVRKSRVAIFRCPKGDDWVDVGNYDEHAEIKFAMFDQSRIVYILLRNDPIVIFTHPNTPIFTAIATQKPLRS